MGYSLIIFNLTANVHIKQIHAVFLIFLDMECLAQNGFSNSINLSPDIMVSFFYWLSNTLLGEYNMFSLFG